MKAQQRRASSSGLLLTGTDSNQATMQTRYSPGVAMHATSFLHFALRACCCGLTVHPTVAGDDDVSAFASQCHPP